MDRFEPISMSQQDLSVIPIIFRHPRQEEAMDNGLYMDTNLVQCVSVGM